jgi:hypothetical protein
MYISYIDHDHYGRLWYKVELRNLYLLGNTLEQNLDAGPIFDASLLEYGIYVGDRSLEGAIQRLENQIKAYRDYNKDLPKPVKKLTWKQRIKLYFFHKRGKRGGTLNPITWPEVSKNYDG